MNRSSCFLIANEGMAFSPATRIIPSSSSNASHKAECASGINAGRTRFSAKMPSIRLANPPPSERGISTIFTWPDASGTMSLLGIRSHTPEGGNIERISTCFAARLRLIGRPVFGSRAM